MFDRLKAKIRARREARRDRGTTPVEPSEPDRSSSQPARRPGLLARIAMELLKKLLAAGIGSVKGQVKIPELLKAMVTAFGGTSVTAIVLAILGSLSNNVASIFPNPVAAYFAGLLITFIMDTIRRAVAGTEPVSLVPGQPVPSFGTFVPTPPPTGINPHLFSENPAIDPGDLPTGPNGVVR